MQTNVQNTEYRDPSDDLRFTSTCAVWLSALTPSSLRTHSHSRSSQLCHDHSSCRGRSPRSRAQHAAPLSGLLCVTKTSDRNQRMAPLSSTPQPLLCRRRLHG
jgi:hypothetical protein